MKYIMLTMDGLIVVHRRDFICAMKMSYMLQPVTLES